MEPKEFCYWLKGFFELLEAGPKTPARLTLTAEQTEMIEKHLRSVFQEKIMYQPLTTPLAPIPGLTGPTCSGMIC